MPGTFTPDPGPARLVIFDPNSATVEQLFVPPIAATHIGRGSPKH
jgi:hypothetical protein